MAVSAPRSVVRCESESAVRAPAGARASRRILFFGTYDSRRYQSVRVLRDGLAALGNDVIECNVPLRFPPAARVKVLPQPWRLPVLLLKLIVAWGRLWLKARQVPA